MEATITDNSRALPEGHIQGQPLTALAPMQDVTDQPFMTVISECGSPDYFFTEYFRVHTQSNLEKHILRSITENETRRPVFAQMIGEDAFHLKRTVKQLQQYPIAGIDLNMGCPAPRVYKKNVGGGLLRDPKKVDTLLGELRDSCPGLFTVKMRIGFEDTRHFDQLLELINKHSIDLLSLHGRTVKEMYRSLVHYDCIKHAVEVANCPTLANGDVTSAKRAQEILAYTGAAGVMVGRHAIRNPWIFQQIRDLESGHTTNRITLAEVNTYVKRLYEMVSKPWASEKARVSKMKKYLNFVGQGVDSDGAFLHQARRAQTKVELFSICDEYMLSSENQYFADEPYEGLVARPNCEK